MQNLFSYPLKVEDMGSGSKKYQLKASSEQLKYVAEVLKLDNILRFESDIEVSFLRKNHKINIKGSLVADVEETSVISLEKFIKTYTPNFEIVFDTELTEEFLRGFARDAGVTLHTRQIAGVNSHHIIEGAFKALGRVLAQAVAIDERFKNEVPSTKGVL